MRATAPVTVTVTVAATVNVKVTVSRPATRLIASLLALLSLLPGTAALGQGRGQDPDPGQDQGQLQDQGQRQGPNPSIEAARLLAALRAGGYVIVMRHAESPRARPPPAQADPDNVRDERQLDARGRASARAMGAALRALHIPIGAVLSSPTYRTLETVRLAGLGAPLVVAELGEPGAHRIGDRRRSVAWLHMRVALAPPAGTDVLVVTHSSNMLAAFGPRALPGGEALIFRPDGHGGTALLAHVSIDEWPRLAASVEAPAGR